MTLSHEKSCSGSGAVCSESVIIKNGILKAACFLFGRRGLVSGPSLAISVLSG